MFKKILLSIRKSLLIVSLMGILCLNLKAQDYTFVFKGHLTQVIDNYGKLNGTDIAVGSPFTGYFTYETDAEPWFVPPWTGNYTYRWVKAYRFTVQTAQGNYEFGYRDSSAAFYQVDVRNYDKLWWGQSGINGTIAKTDFPSQQGTYHVGFNLSNYASSIWSVAYPLPTSLNVNDFDLREVSFHGNYNSNTIDYRIVGQMDLAEVPVPTNSGPVCQVGTVNLFTDTIPGASYAWTGPNNFSSTLQNPIITGVTTATGGNYTVTATTVYGSASAATAVVVNAPNPVISGDTTMCPQQTSTTLSTGNYATYLWTPGGETTQSIIINAPVTCTVNVTDSLGCTGSSLPATVIRSSFTTDFDFDGVVTTADFLIFNGLFGQACTCPQDLDNDGFVNTADFIILIGDFNQVCQ